jgi:hypothetical protein
VTSRARARPRADEPGDLGAIPQGGGGAEKPIAWRWLDEVLAARDGMVRVQLRLRPLVILVVGLGEADPNKN